MYLHICNFLLHKDGSVNNNKKCFKIIDHKHSSIFITYSQTRDIRSVISCKTVRKLKESALSKTLRKRSSLEDAAHANSIGSSMLRDIWIGVQKSFVYR